MNDERRAQEIRDLVFALQSVASDNPLVEAINEAAQVLDDYAAMLEPQKENVMTDERPIRVAIFCEGDFEKIVDTYETLGEAAAFASGVSEGASFYGAGSCSAYVLPGDEAQMIADEDHSQVGRALTAAYPR